MSPGSFVSSESAGSSNSLDDPDVEPGSNRLIMTPLDDHVTPGNAILIQDIKNGQIRITLVFHFLLQLPYLKNPQPNLALSKPEV